MCLIAALALFMCLCLSACGGMQDPFGNPIGSPSSPAETPSETPTENHIHTEQIIPAVPPTCVSIGYTEGKKCSECGEIILAPAKMAMLAHTPVTVKGTPATCLKTGISDGAVCSGCDTVIMEQVTLAAKGHIWNMSYESDENNHWQKCSGCDEITSKSDHEKNGTDICNICGYGCAHKNTKWQNFSSSTCSEQGIDVKNCLDCGAIVEQKKLELLPHTPEGKVSCTTSITCSVCKAVVEGAKGHTPGDAATCTTKQICTVCGEVLVDTLGHFEVSTDYLPPSCTKPGLEGGVHCARCKIIISAQTEIPPTGHNYKYSMCTGCGDMITPDDVKPTTLPRIDVNTGGAAINSKDIYTSAIITLSGCDDNFVFSDITAGIRLRGNSTAGAAKKPYRIKFDQKQNLLGLNNGKKFKSWVLLADYFDSTMLRTYSTFSMADILNDDKYFSSDCAPVEVYINGNYQGVYLLCEQSQIDGNRVDIYEREDTDTSLEIGYLLIGQGGRTDEPNTVSISTSLYATDRNGTLGNAGGGNFSISGGDYTDAQIAYVKKYVEGVYEVIRRAIYENSYYSLDRQGNLSPRTQFKGKTAQEKQIETIDAVFNIDACVRLCILDEIVKNLDAGTFNMYVDLSPEGDGRLTLGPPWDFDFAMANTKYDSTHSPYDYYATNFTYSDGMRVNTIFVLFGNLPWFEEMIKDVWDEYVDELYGVANNLSVMTELYGEQYQRDYAYWNRSLLFHHCADCHSKFTCHADAVDFLSDWLYKRLDWLDYVWGDGEKPEMPEAPQNPEIPETDAPLTFDFTNSELQGYLKNFKRCSASVTNSGLRVEITEGRDPYFTFDISLLGETFYAQNYKYLEIEYMLPTSNLYDPYNNMQIFLCAGTITGADELSSVASYINYPDGQYHTLTFNLSNVQLWQGEIHNIRIDPFGSCQVGDVMYIKSIKFCK